MDPHLSRRAFRDGKRGILAELGAAVDRSPKGSVDAPIAAWVAEFNRRGAYVTTSSCSGRVALYAHAPSEEDALAVPEGVDGAQLPPPGDSLPRSSKGVGHWLIVTHGPALPRGTEIAAALASAPPGCSEAALKVEPFILHVLCEDVAAARALQSVAVACGFRESGIGIGTSGRVIVAVRSTAHMLDVPLLAGGRVIADAAYLDGLAGVVAQRFRAIEARREGFMARVLETFPAPPPPPPLPQPVQSQLHPGGVTCTECSGTFASRNALFSHLANSPAEGKRFCPVAAAAAAVAPAVAAPAAAAPARSSSASLPPAPAVAPLSSAGTVDGLQLHRCKVCPAAFPSRNKLFAHVQSAHAATGGAASEGDVAARPPSAPGGAATLGSVAASRTLPAIAPTVAPHAADIAAASAARAASLKLMQRVAARRARGPAATPRPALQWRQEAPTTPASPRCWGHSAVLLREAPAGRAGGAAPSHGLVAVFGGFLLREGGQQHGRSGETRVMDTRSRAWRRCREGPPGCAPAPRMRHAAVSVPLRESDEACGPGNTLADALLVHGGRAGPANPLGDCWLGRVSAPHPEGDAEVQWGAVAAVGGTCPSPRWGHSLHVLPAAPLVADPAAEGAAESPNGRPALLLFGGRDAARCLGDVWVGRMQLASGSDGDAVAWAPFVCSGAGPGPRCYHGAALLTPPGDDQHPAFLVVHGGMGDAAAGPEEEVGTPLFGHGRLLGADALHVLDLRTRSWARLAPRAPASLQARMSHCIVSLPPVGGRPGGVADDGACRLLVFGGSVLDPEQPDAELVSVSSGALAVTSEALTETHSPASSDGAATAPLVLRAAAVLVPPASDAEASGSSAEPRVLVVGGGCVAFAFGSYASPTCEAPLPLLLQSSPPPRVELSDSAKGAARSESIDGLDLAVPASEAQWVRIAVTERGWLDAARRCRPDAAAGRQKRIRVPITQAAAEALSTIDVSAPSPEARLAALLHSGEAEIAVGGGKGSTAAPAFISGDRRGGPNAIARAASDLRALLAANPSLVSAAAADRLATPGAPGGLPRHVEWVGDILVLPRDSMIDPVWPKLSVSSLEPRQPPVPGGLRLVSAPTWDCIAAALGSERVARAATIDPGVTRRSRMTLLRYYEIDDESGAAHDAGGLDPCSGWALLRDSLAPARGGGDDVTIAPAVGPLPPSSADSSRRLARAVAVLRGARPAPPGGWALVRDAGVSYVLDVTRLMLSSGNVTEKLRVGALPATGEVVADLYVGIGYWTLPLLVRARAAHVHACDWNPDAIACLRLGLSANHVPADRVTVWPGDNAQLRGRGIEADRVFLGLIPSSEGSWGTAVSLLRLASGGWLHVHMNQPEEGVAAFAAELEAALGALAAEMGRRGWVFSVRHVERVKSYAPRVWHCVYDVEARPPPS